MVSFLLVTFIIGKNSKTEKFKYTNRKLHLLPVKKNSHITLPKNLTYTPDAPWDTLKRRDIFVTLNYSGLRYASPEIVP